MAVLPCRWQPIRNLRHNPTVRWLAGPLHRPLRWALHQRWRRAAHAALLREWAGARDSGAPVRLHVGAGPHRLKGWLNTDVHPPAPLYLDMSRPLPFPTASVDTVYGEQVIEHLTLEEAEAFLAEAFRVLRPGGAIRLSTPALDRYAAAYANGTPELAALETFLAGRGGRAFGAGGAAVLNTQFHGWGHRYLHDLDSLSSLLARAGFDAVHQREVQQSEHPELRGIEQHDQGTVLDAFTLVVEAAKPPAPGAA